MFAWFQVCFLAHFTDSHALNKEAHLGNVGRSFHYQVLPATGPVLAHERDEVRYKPQGLSAIDLCEQMARCSP